MQTATQKSPKWLTKYRFAKALAEVGLTVDERDAKRIAQFAEDFDPAKTYPQNWWDLKFKHKRIKKIITFAFARSLAYTIPTVEAIADIGILSKGKTVHEYMAGSGYWAFLMKSWGVTVNASDIMDENYAFHHFKPFVPLQNIDMIEAIPSPNEVVMVAWIPHLLEPINFLKRMVPKQKLIHIADLETCAGPKLFKYLSEHFRLFHQRDLYSYGKSQMKFYEKV